MRHKSSQLDGSVSPPSASKSSVQFAECSQERRTNHSTCIPSMNWTLHRFAVSSKCHHIRGICIWQCHLKGSPRGIARKRMDWVQLMRSVAAFSRQRGSHGPREVVSSPQLAVNSSHQCLMRNRIRQIRARWRPHSLGAWLKWRERLFRLSQIPIKVDAGRLKCPIPFQFLSATCPTHFRAQYRDMNMPSTLRTVFIVGARARCNSMGGTGEPRTRKQHIARQHCILRYPRVLVHASSWHCWITLKKRAAHTYSTLKRCDIEEGRTDD
jgi:hypothetical protein